MKKINLKKIAIFAMLAFIMASCEKWIDPEINVDPDSPAEMNMNLLLPSIEANLAFTTVGGNDITRTESMWVQQLDGIARQSQAEAIYTLRAGDVNNLWNTTYAGSMMDAKQLYDLSIEKNSPNFGGVSRVLMAVALGQATDVWGDIPYSEALQADVTTTPVFDSQQSVYAAIQALLDEGIQKLQEDANDFALSGDYIYGANLDQWVKAAYALKARYALHLSNVENEAYTKALTYLGNAFTSLDDNMKVDFFSGSTSSNPFYQFMVDRGDVRMGTFFINYLKENADPRLPVLAEPIAETIHYYKDGVLDSVVAGGYFGSPAVVEQGADPSPLENASAPGSAIAAADAPVYFITYTELLFIKTEAEFKTSTGDAKATLKQAVATSLEQYGVSDDAWLADLEAKIDGLSGDDLFKEIMIQKYTALAYQNENFVDFRRTNNVIGLELHPLTTATEFPRRFIYPTDAVTFNPNTPANVTLYDRVWWDGGN